MDLTPVKRSIWRWKEKEELNWKCHWQNQKVQFRKKHILNALDFFYELLLTMTSSALQSFRWISVLFFILFFYFAILSSTKYSSPQMDWFSVLFMPLPLAHCCNYRIFYRIFYWIFSHNHFKRCSKELYFISLFICNDYSCFFLCHWHCFNIEECKARAHGREQFSNWKPLFIVSVFIPKSQAAFHSKNLKLLRTKFHLWPSITFTVHTNNVFEKKNCNWFWDRVGINRSRQIHLSIPKMDDTHYTELWKSQEAIFNLFKQFKLASYLFRGKKVCSW